MKINKIVMYWIVFILMVIVVIALGETWTLVTSDGEITINTSEIRGTTFPCENISGGSDTDFCDDATGAASDPTKWTGAGNDTPAWNDLQASVGFKIGNLSNVDSDNITLRNNELVLNITCETITGSADLCDGDDATGTGTPHVDNASIQITEGQVTGLTSHYSLTNFTSNLADRLGELWNLANFTTAIGNRLGELWNLGNFTTAYDNRPDRFVYANLSTIGNNPINLSAALNVSGNVTFTQLLSCDTINTDATGLLTCGIDETGSFTKGDSLSATNVNVTGTLNITGFGFKDGSEIATLADLTGGNVTVTEIIRIQNKQGESVGPLKLMHFSGYNVGANVPEAQFAVSTSRTKQAECITSETIANNGFGSCVVSGLINNVDTSQFTEDVLLHMNKTDGTLTEKQPTDVQCVQEIGEVLRSHATLGVMFANVPPGCEEVPNFVNITGNLTIAKTANFTVEDLVSCDTIDTDATGLFTCGNDETGAGGGDTDDLEITNTSMLDNGTIIRVGNTSALERGNVTDNDQIANGAGYITSATTPGTALNITNINISGRIQTNLSVLKS